MSHYHHGAQYAHHGYHEEDPWAWDEDLGHHFTPYHYEPDAYYEYHHHPTHHETGTHYGELYHHHRVHDHSLYDIDHGTPVDMGMHFTGPSYAK